MTAAEVATPTTTTSVIHEWLEQLYGTAEASPLTLFTVDRETGLPRTSWGTTRHLDRFAEMATSLAPHSCVWFGVATRTERLSGNKRGGNSQCAAIPGLWLDIDIEGPGHASGGRLARDEAHAHQLVDLFPVKPTAVVHSGGGLQAWWLFAEMMDADDAAQRLLAQWGATWERLADTIGMDVDNVFDMARIMRMPGTMNLKTDTPRPVTIEAADWTRRYGADDLEQHLDDAPAPKAHRTGTDMPYIGPERPGDAYSLRHTGGDILGRHGFTLHRTDQNGDEHWTRPGKDRGTSAVVYAEDKHTTIYSDAVTGMWPALEVRRPYDPFGLYACIEHGGDFGEATRALRAAGYGSTTEPITLGELAGAGATPKQAALAATLEAEPQAWPEPLGFPEADPRPTFPIDAFPQWVADQVRNVANQLECDPIIPAVFALGALSIASLGHLTIAIRAGQVDRSTGLYLAVGGNSATGKSPALDFMMGPVHEHEDTLTDAAKGEIAKVVQRRKVAQKALDLLSDKASASGDPDHLVRAETAAAEMAEIADPPHGELTTTDCTPEMIAQLMQRNAERFAVVSDEADVFDVDRYGDKGGMAKLGIYLQGFTGQRVKVHRVKGGAINLKAPLLAFCAGAQLEPLERALNNPQWRERGLSARFLVASTDKIATNVDIDNDVYDYTIGNHYDDTLGGLCRRWSSWQTPALLTITPEGRRRFSTWARDVLERSVVGDLAGELSWSSKMRTSTIRIAALLHASQSPSGTPGPITDEAMANAIRIVEFFIASHLHAASDQSPDALRLLASLVKMAEKEGAAPGNEARRGLKTARSALTKLAPPSLRKVDAYMEPLVALVKAGYVRPIGAPGIANMQVSDAIRNSPVLEIHPASLEMLQSAVPRGAARFSPVENAESAREANRAALTAPTAIEVFPEPPPHAETRPAPSLTPDPPRGGRGRRGFARSAPSADLCAGGSIFDLED